METEVRNTLKKRDVLPHLNKLIETLVGISGDCSKLEINDNWEASRRIRAVLLRMRRVDFPYFESLIKDIRFETKNYYKDRSLKKKKKGVTRNINVNNLKK